MKAVGKVFAMGFLALLFGVGCISRKATLVGFDTGEVLKAKFTDSMSTTGRITVTMPDGEILKGKYSGVRGQETLSFGSAFGSGTVTTPTGTAFGSASGTATGYSVGGQGKAYGLLASTKPGSKLMMEIFAVYGVLGGHGWGEARTNDGRVYKLQF